MTLVKKDYERNGEHKMPEQDAINRIMELQKSLPEEHSQQLNTLLSNAPRWLLESMQIITKKKHTVFIEENNIDNNQIAEQYCKDNYGKVSINKE